LALLFVRTLAVTAIDGGEIVDVGYFSAKTANQIPVSFER
jgi:hypothetical protein